jgi:hypothetical protein
MARALVHEGIIAVEFETTEVTWKRHRRSGDVAVSSQGLPEMMRQFGIAPA